MADDPQAPLDPINLGQAIGNNEPPPNVGASNATPRLAPQPVQGQVAGGKLPLLGQLLANVIKPPMQMQAAPGQMATMRPVSRANEFEGFLGQFLFAMGQGMQAAGHGPGAFGRGFGGAMTAPFAQQQMQNNLQQQQAGIQSQQAETQLRQAQTQQMGQMVTLPNGMSVPLPLAKTIAPQLFAAQGREQAATISGQFGLEKAKIQQGMMVDVPQELQEQFGAPKQLPLQQLNRLESAANRPLTVVQGAAGPAILNKQTLKTKNLGLGAPALAKPLQVADPNTPGGTMYVPAGEAMRQGMQSASSAAVKVPAAVLKDFTSGASAKTLNSFNTAADHLKILSDLGDALNNGSVPLINSFANRFATATGSAAPTSFDMAKQAVAGEVAKTFKGQATEGEISALNSVIGNAQSPAQLKGAINTALTLMNSKREALMRQYDQGIKSSPAFPKQPQSSPVDNLVGRYK